MRQRHLISALALLCATLLLCACAGESSTAMFDCVHLNACTRACANATCVEECRTRATASAIDKESALQTCFESACPQSNGAGDAVCMQDSSGAFSSDCVRCIENTQVARNLDCTPAQAPECHACLVQFDLCNADE